MRVRPVSIRVCAASILAAVVFGSVPAVSAQTADVQALRQEIEQLRNELEAMQQQYAERLSALEARLAAGNVQAPATAAAPGATGSLPIYSAATAASKIFNPDIGVIGNFIRPRHRAPRAGRGRAATDRPRRDVAPGTVGQPDGRSGRRRGRDVSVPEGVRTQSRLG